MKLYIKIILIIFIFYAKNILAANFTIGSIGDKTIADYDNYVNENTNVDTIIFDTNGSLTINGAGNTQKIS